jgi:hypothetical protein
VKQEDISADDASEPVDRPGGNLRSRVKRILPLLFVLGVWVLVGWVLALSLKLIRPNWPQEVIDYEQVPGWLRPILKSSSLAMGMLVSFVMVTAALGAREWLEFLQMQIEKTREFDPELFIVKRPGHTEADGEPYGSFQGSAEDFGHRLDQLIEFTRGAGPAGTGGRPMFRWTFVVGYDPLQPLASGRDAPARDLVTELGEGDNRRLARFLRPFRARRTRAWVVAQIQAQERDKLPGWRPRRPTLLLLERPEAGQIADVLARLAHPRRKFRYPVRLLVVVRDIPASMVVIRDAEGKYRCEPAAAHFAPPIGELVFPSGYPERAHAKPIWLHYQSIREDFIGRDIFLKQLHDRVGKPPTADECLAVEVIYGMGGLGKTRIAVEYAWCYKSDYSALLFVDAESPEALRRSLAGLAAEPLNLPEAGGADDTRLAAVRRWLNSTPGWLMIFDNVDTHEALNETIDQLGKLRGGVVVITSRLSQFPVGYRVNRVDQLTPEDAAKYLQNVTDGTSRGGGRRKLADDSTVALRLADSLGYLALALVHAGGYINTERCTLLQYEERIKFNMNDLLENSLEPGEKSIALTFRTSLDRLHEGRALLEHVAWLAPERIPEALLDVSVPGAESPDQIKGLKDLDSYSLATRNNDAAAPAFSVHRLVQALARANLPQEMLEQRLGEAVRWLAEAMKPAGSAFKGQTTELIPHVLRVLHYLQGDRFRDSKMHEFLDPLARLVIFAVLRAHAPAEAVRSSDRLVVPEYLISMLGSFYEIEPLSGAVDLLVLGHPGEWPVWQRQLLQSDNYVLRFAMAASLSTACVRDPPAAAVADVVALVEHPSDLNEFELGGYAISMIFATQPELIGRLAMEDVANRLANREEYSGRSILGDLLLNLVFRGTRDAYHDLRGLVKSERFWNPIWDYLKIDIAAFEAAEAFLATPRRTPTSDDRPEVIRSYANLKQIETDAAHLLETAGSSEALRVMLENYFNLPQCTFMIRNAELQLSERPDLVDFIRLLFRHPIWAVGEAGATVLSTLLVKDERHAAIIPALLEDPVWRVRYGAIEAAFARRHQDEQLFFHAVNINHADGNPKIAGLCVENLASMILNAGADRRVDLMAAFDAEIRHWLTAEDCWVLEHVHHLFHVLDARRIDVKPWLRSDVSRLFEGELEWYRLPREAFLKHIERRKVCLVGMTTGR